MFISFEGIDGSGKSTQVSRLAASLRAEGREVLLVREPGGTPLSESVRSLLLDPQADIHPLAELFLFTAARAQLVHGVIQPALASGTVVIADRYADSTLAYQGAGRGVSDVETLRSIQSCATSGLQPDHTFVLDIAPEDAAQRRSNRGGNKDRMEGASLDFYHRVRDSYLKLATQAPERIHVLDARQPEAELATQIWQSLASSN
ncbi:MAG: dTMP kinase [Rubricoccaceae bacterium]